MRALNVAEKPSVAKAVAGILSKYPSSGGLRVRDGRSRFNRIFEFNYSIQNQQFQMAFTSVTGHLMEIEFDERYRKWHSCDPVDLYHAPVRKHVPQDKTDIQKTLEEEARKCQWLILWLDCDREGENIAFEVVEVCTRANRNLNIWRARFSALIDRDIHYAVQHLVRPNQLFADAVDVRQEIDLRIGASFTRFQTMLLKDAFVLDFSTDDRNLVLSYGPCQFPTLGFVVERFWENQSHEPEEFWTINCTHNSDEGTATFSWMRGHLFDYTCATILYELCVLEPIATVINVRQQEKLKYPPHPLSTIELEKRASRYFRMSSEQTMKIGISFSKTIMNSIRPRVEEIGKIPATDNVFCNLVQYPVATKIPGILIVRINSGTFCFANANFIRQRIMKLVEEENETEENTKRGGLRVLILDMSNVMNIDTSAIHALEELHRDVVSRGIDMAVTNPKWQVITKMKASKFVDKIGDGWIFLSVADAVDASTSLKFNALNNC